MNKLWRLAGMIAFWVSWPLLFVYLRIGKRTRVLIIANDQIVVTKGWLGTGKWSLPGGGIHRDEESTAGAIREVFEETGLDLTPNQLKLIGEETTSELGLKFAHIQFVVELNQNVALNPKRLEIIEATWIPIDDLGKHNTEKASLVTLANWKKQR